jgi:two-component system, OmpR family, alkaline phosphatase synthesis response regulator PhoP
LAREQVLVVEDEVNILELITFNLTKEGFLVRGVTTGEEALRSIRAEPPSAILLDLMLPGTDGIGVCRRVRAESATASIPIMMVTAKGDEADIIRGLDAGADDYLTKPFSPRVLVARVRALLRRASRVAKVPADGLIHRGDISIHVGRHEVLVAGTTISLTSTEFRLLAFLVANAGWVYSRAQIVEAIRGSDYYVTDRSVDVLVFGLRRKLGEHGVLVETVRGVGYRFREE